MAQSLVKNYLQIILNTKNRIPLILPQHEKELHSYLGGFCNNLNCDSIKISGYTEHVHVLCKLSKNIALTKLLKNLKTHSSKWMKTMDESLRNVYWQDGFGAGISPFQGLFKLLFVDTGLAP